MFLLGVTGPRDTPEAGMGSAEHPEPTQRRQRGQTSHPATDGCWQLPAVTWLCKSIDSLYPKQTSPLRITPVKAAASFFFFFPARSPTQLSSDS